MSRARAFTVRHVPGAPFEDFIAAITRAWDAHIATLERTAPRFVCAWCAEPSHVPMRQHALHCSKSPGRSS